MQNLLQHSAYKLLKRNSASSIEISNSLLINNSAIAATDKK